MRKFAEIFKEVVIAIGDAPDIKGWEPGLPEWDWIPDGLSVEQGWAYKASKFIPPTHHAWEVSDFTEAIQSALDAWAQERNYDGILSLCSYANSTNSKFNAEGKCGVTARDSAWAYAYGYLHDVETGKRPLMSPAELLKELPPFKWPES